MKIVRWSWFALAAGCYAPAAPTGAPCTTDAECPSAQRCHPISKTCELACAGCDPDAAPPGGDAAPPADAPVDQMPPAETCWDEWLDGSIQLSTPELVAELSDSIVNTFDPSLEADGLAIFVSRGGDLLRAERPSREARFGALQLVSELSTGERSTRVSVTGDGLVAVFGAQRAGGAGGDDLWQATRGATTLPFSGITDAPFAAIDDAGDQFDPELTPDGRVLYYAPVVGGNGAQRIFRAARATPTGAFAPPVDVLPDAALASLADPSISPDERVLVFAGTTNLAMPDDVYVATRATATAPFGTPRRLPELSTAVQDGDLELSSDGCELVLSSDRGFFVRRIYRSTAAP